MLNTFYIFFKIYLNQVMFFCILLTFLFFIFEVLPLFFIKENTIKKNFTELFRYQLLRGLFAVTLGVIFSLFIFITKMNVGVIDITHLSYFIQVIIVYLSTDFIIYTSHRAAHIYKIPFLSKAHRFHHTITTNLQWTNSRKEHLLVISLFVFIFCFFLYTVFKVSKAPALIIVNIFLLLLSFSHFKIPFTIPYLDKFFLFPKDHLRHHTNRSGPYGVTLSIFDTLFKTRDD